MERKDFLKFAVGGIVMNSLNPLKSLANALPQQDKLMPVIFMGHGSPMNGIEDNEFSRTWSSIARQVETPRAVLVISAHWYTRGTRVTAMAHPKTIHDFGGFPKALFDVQYPAPGNPQLAEDIANSIKTAPVALDHDWGLDHGAWTVIRHMYPNADIPVLQLSIDYSKPPQYHYDLAQELFYLRKKGVLIMGSGNMVHNLRMVSWEMINGGGYDWAIEQNEDFKKLIRSKEHKKLIDFTNLGKAAQLAIPTPDHYIPLLYSLALQGKDDEVSFFNDKAVGGSLTMTSVLLS